MKVNDFAKRIGLPNSTIRFYDRIEITESERTAHNNYRNYNNLDALNIYSAQSLRGFNFSIEDTKKALNSGMKEVAEFVAIREEELELEILKSKQRLDRLKEVVSFVEMAESHHNQVFEYTVDDHYMVESFGESVSKKLTALEKKTIEDLSNALPFSYVAIHIRKEDLLAESDIIPTQIGLGILEHKRAEIGLELDSKVKKVQGKKCLAIYAKVEDPFNIDRKVIQPILDEVQKMGLEVKDFYGRLYITYTENGKKFHGITVGYSIE